MNIGSYTMALDMYIQSDFYSSFDSYTWVWFGVTGSSAADSYRTPVLFGYNQIELDRWMHLEVTFANAAQAHQLGIILDNPNTNYWGTMYFDNIQLISP
jgi:hypothetical protein